MTAELSQPPLPEPDETTRFFWEGARQHRLLIQRCADCGYYAHPPRPLCRRCLSTNLAPQQMSGRGRVYCYTVTRHVFHPAMAKRLPYVVAIVELEEQPGLRLVSGLRGIEPGQVRTGMPVSVTFRRVDDEVTLPEFEPALVGGKR